jgi:TetR/AcrR family transcriptional repressor of nem operon
MTIDGKNMEKKEQAILKITEEMVRRGGYNGFSFREIAKQVGIKSSSVHYHFPTKEDLGVAVAKYYTERFFETLGQAQELLDNNRDPIQSYVSAFRQALSEDKRMCLCGLLGAEIDGLPERVVEQTQEFFRLQLAWLEDAYRLMDPDNNTQTIARKKASQTLALLEGAIVTSNVLDDISLFDSAAELLLSPA